MAFLVLKIVIFGAKNKFGLHLKYRKSCDKKCSNPSYINIHNFRLAAPIIMFDPSLKSYFIAASNELYIVVCKRLKKMSQKSLVIKSTLFSLLNNSELITLV